MRAGMSPLAMILMGLLLSLLGVAFPALMVIHDLPSTFFLNFFSFTASMSGLILGILGAARYSGTHRKLQGFRRSRLGRVAREECCAAC